MAHAQTCPLCGGTGNKNGAPNNLTGTNEICRGCGGLGWVTVQDNENAATWPLITYNPPLNFIVGSF